MINTLFYFANSEAEYLAHKQEIASHTIVLCKEENTIWRNGERYGGDGSVVRIDPNESTISYAINDSSTEHPTNENDWVSERPAAEQGRYLWTRDITAYTDGTHTITYGVVYFPLDGAGTEIDKNNTFIRYSTQKTQQRPPVSTFTLNEPPTLEIGDWLWVLNRVTYEGGTPLDSYSVSRVGDDGAKGDPGADGYTTHFAYATSADGIENFSTSNFLGATYIGTCRDNLEYDPGHDAETPEEIAEAAAQYIWTKWKGDNGQNGVSSYIHVKYSNDAGAHFTDNNGDTPGYYMGQCVDNNASAPTDVTLYTWALIKSLDGDDTIDQIPTKDSPNAVSSGGVYDVTNGTLKTRYIPIDLRGESIVFLSDEDMTELFGPATMVGGQSIFDLTVGQYQHIYRVTNSKSEVFEIPAAYHNANGARKIVGINGNLTIELSFTITNGVYVNAAIAKRETSIPGISYEEEQDLTPAQRRTAQQNIGLEKDVAGGVAGLDGNGKIVEQQIPTDVVDGANLGSTSVQFGAAQQLTPTQQVQAQNNVFAKAYSSDASVHSGLGKIYLDKNNGSLTQAMINTANTVYVIRYDYTLAADITIPENCVLEFDGGSLKHGTIKGNHTGISAGLVKIFDTDLTLSSVDGLPLSEGWNVKVGYPEWFGAKGVNGIDDSDAIEKTLMLGCKYVKLNKLFYISKPICLYSHVHIIGNYGMHTYTFGIKVNSDFGPLTFNNQTIKSIFYCNSKLSAPLIIESAYFDGSYKANTLVHYDASARCNIRLYRCHLFRFYEAGVAVASSDGSIMKECLIQYCGVGIAASGKEINYNKPLVLSDTIIGRPNHIIITKCIFNRCNVGIIVRYCSDCILTGNLFGHDSLCSIYITECNATIYNNYVEDDWNCGFWISENGTDPELTKPSPSYFNPVLSDKDVDIRAYIILNNVVLTIDGSFYSNYYVRCNKNVGGNAYEDKTVSGIDSLIYFTNKCTLNIGSSRVVRLNSSDDTQRYIYDVISRGVYYDDKSYITSDKVITYRNIINNASGQSYFYSLDYRVLNTIEKKNRASYLGSQILNQCPSGDHAANFVGKFTLCKNVGGTSLYKRANSAREHNSLYIDASALGDNLYRAEIKTLFANGSVQRGISITATYSDGEDETISCGRQMGDTSLLTDVLYFTKADFIRSGKTLTGLYVYDSAYIGAQLNDYVSSIMLYLEGCDEPVYISLPAFGPTSTRPKVSSELCYEYFDTTINKHITWNGTRWVDEEGATAGSLKSGTFAQKPSSNNIYDGYDYYCTDLRMTIYYRNGMWVNADGELVGYNYKKQITDFVSGQYAVTNVDVGNTVPDATSSPSSQYYMPDPSIADHKEFDVRAGDVVVVEGLGFGYALLWALVDSNRLLVRKAVESETKTGKIPARVVVNVDSAGVMIITCKNETASPAYGNDWEYPYKVTVYSNTAF